MTIRLIQGPCLNCHRFSHMGIMSDRLYCDAFGDDPIPDEIADGDNDHTAPFPGDNGMQYVPWKD